MTASREPCRSSASITRSRASKRRSPSRISPMRWAAACSSDAEVSAPILAPVDDGRCFACGPHNADGLHLHFEPDGDDGARSAVTLPPRMQGYREVAHGGIV